jgi:GNAT superfamily N-acetyltransferase
VADGDDGVVGFVNLSPARDDDSDPDTVGEIPAIYLLAGAQGAGLGRRLMARAIDGLRAAGFREATLWVLDTNKQARRFYEAVGWTADGAAKIDDSLGLPLSEVRYRRSIPAPESGNAPPAPT